jgi:DNA primase
MIDQIVQACSYLLENYPGAEETRVYLSSRLKKEHWEKWQFGFLPGIEEMSVLSSLIGEDILREHKIITSWSKKGAPNTIEKAYFQGQNLILPFRDAYGKAVGLVARSIFSPEKQAELQISKYKNSEEGSGFKKGQLLFALDLAKEAIEEEGMVVVVEGQMDAIAAHTAGMRHVVALGTSSMSFWQFSILMRYTHNVVLLLDNDESGEKGRAKIVRQFSNYCSIHNWYLPEQFKDIDEALKAYGGTVSSIPFRMEII